MTAARWRQVLLWTVAPVVLVGPLAVAGVLVLTARDEAPPAVIPAEVSVAPAAVPPPAHDGYVSWAADVGARTGISPRALVAYANAEAVLSGERPDCHLGWVTLAGVARVESEHGSYGGRAVDAGGRPDRPIIGVPLDGVGPVAAITDTDGGVVDGDPVWDRAVGPFQFLPSTWERHGADGDGDGVAEPQDLDDAAVAAGRYLCVAGGDLSTGAGWWRAVLAYNRSATYARTVLANADRYATESRNG